MVSVATASLNLAVAANINAAASVFTPDNNAKFKECNNPSAFNLKI